MQAEQIGAIIWIAGVLVTTMVIILAVFDEWRQG